MPGRRTPSRFSLLAARMPLVSPASPCLLFLPVESWPRTVGVIERCALPVLRCQPLVPPARRLVLLDPLLVLGLVGQFLFVAPAPASGASAPATPWCCAGKWHARAAVRLFSDDYVLVPVTQAPLTMQQGVWTASLFSRSALEPKWLRHLTHESSSSLSSNKSASPQTEEHNTG